MLRVGEDSEDRAGVAAADDDAIFCRACARLVTRVRWRASEGGQHRHLFVNPAGIAFEIACFAEAPGVAASGPATLEATWFPRYAWRIVRCRGCARHLGWRFEAVDGRRVFLGLIRDRLTRAPG